MSKNINELREELERFVEFGAILDKQTRKYLARYLQSYVDPEMEAPEGLQDAYYRYFSEALESLFSSEELVDIFTRQGMLSRQIVSDTLTWLRRTYEQISKDNPFQEEKKRLDHWAAVPLHRIVSHWPQLVGLVEEIYGKDELPTSFYRRKFQELIGQKSYEQLSHDSLREIERILEDLLAQWDARLQAKLLDYQIRKMNEHKDDFQDKLEEKAQEQKRLSRIVEPFAEYLGRFWDMSREPIKSTDFDVLQRYDDLLQDEASIQRLADLLGRMREAELEMEEEAYERTILNREWVRDPNAKSEITGVRESSDLSDMLSTEVSLLGDEDLETVFVKKYLDQSLLTFQYEDHRMVPSTDQFIETDRRIRRKQKGPFIICVDTSESMSGTPEHVAKVLCFAILKMAAAENRPAYLINFSSGIKTLDLYDLAGNLDAVADFLRMSFHGGTDISLPLYEALRQLDQAAYQYADVLMISDFIMYRMDEDILQSIAHQQQNRGTQFHSITLTETPDVRILQQFDTNHAYDPERKGVIRQLFTDVQGIIDRPV